jgi:Icc-related predicted phosphoesterase
MIIAVTGDIHSPHYYEDFLKALDELPDNIDLFLIAGDMIDRGEVSEYEKIRNALFGKVNCPILACFGNNEFEEKEEEIKSICREIRFLSDQAFVIDVKGMPVGIVGTRGSLEEPTKWQRAHIPNIDKIYAQRLQLVKLQLRKIIHTPFKILLMHYAPTYKTLEGENPLFYGTLGWNAFENVIIEMRPNLVIHGHSHRGKKFAWVDTVPVFNVSFPANEKKIVIINTEELKPGLTKFV